MRSDSRKKLRLDRKTRRGSIHSSVQARSWFLRFEMNSHLSNRKDAIRVIPQVAGGHLDMGEVLLELNKPEDAVPHLENAMRLAPPNDHRAMMRLETVRGKQP